MTTLIEALYAELTEGSVGSLGVARTRQESGATRKLEPHRSSDPSVSSEWPDVEARLMEILDRLFDPQSAA